MKRYLIIAFLVTLVAPSYAAQTTRLYGQLVFFGITPDNAEVTLTLTGRDYFTTSTLAVPAGQMVTHTDTAGYFSFSNVVLTDSLRPLFSATYTITIKHPMNQASGIVFEASGLAITTLDSVSLKTLLAQ